MGVIALRGEQPPLAQLPPAALAVAAARVADFGNNALEALPAALGGLAALQRLRLSWNRLSAGSFPGGALAPLQRLTVLALDHNRRVAALMQSCLVLSEHTVVIPYRCKEWLKCNGAAGFLLSALANLTSPWSQLLELILLSRRAT